MTDIMKRIIILILAVLVSGGAGTAYSQNRQYNKTTTHRKTADLLNYFIQNNYTPQQAREAVALAMKLIKEGRSMEDALKEADLTMKLDKMGASRGLNSSETRSYDETIRGLAQKAKETGELREIVDRGWSTMSIEEKVIIFEQITDQSWFEELSNGGLDLMEYDPKDQHQVEILQKASEKEYARQIAELAKEEEKISEYRDSAKPNLEQLRGKLYEVMSPEQKYPWRGSDAEFFGDSNRAANDIRTARDNGVNVDEKTAQAYLNAFEEAKEAYNGAADGTAKAKALKEKLALFREGVNSLGACLDCNVRE